MYVPSNQDDWQSCFYDFQASITCKGKTTQLKDGQISSILLEKDYDNLNTPILLMDLSLDYPLPDNIAADPTATLQLRVDKCIGIQEKNMVTVTNRSLYLNTVFSFVTLDHTPKSTYYEREINKTNQNREGDYLLASTGNVQRYILVKKEDMTASKNIVNAVLKKHTLTQAINMLLTQAGCKSVLMSNLDNMKTFDELYIPPLPLIECLVYLKNKYGFHKEDTSIFMDFDTMYIVRKSSLCTTFKRRETKNICVCLNSPESEYESCSGVLYTGNMTYLNVGYEQFSREVGGTVIDQTLGSEYIIYNETELSSDTVNIKNERALDGGNTNIKSVTGHNPYIGQQLKYRRAEEQNVYTMVCSGADLSVLTPNKHYSIVSNSTEISIGSEGNYRISRQVTSFMRTGNLMVPITTLTLKKTME